MPPGGTVQVEGGRRFRAAARKAGVDLKQLSAIHREAAGIVVGRARTWAPHVSGRLAASIRPAATQRAGMVRAGNNRRRGGVPYAHPIHWGWPARNIKANPFLSYSAQATEPRWVKLYEDKVNDLLNQF